MEHLYYIELNLISMFMLIAIMNNMKKTIDSFKQNKVLSFIIVSVLLEILCDTVSCCLINTNIRAHHILLWLINIIYFMLSGLLSYLWLWYTCYSIYKNSDIWRKKVTILFLPCLILEILVLLSPWKHLIFYIDASNQYHRGILYFIQPIFLFGYLLIASILSMIQGRKEILNEKKHECYYISSFAILPLIGGMLQTFFKINSIMPCIALSILIIYLEHQKLQLFLDFLTGLNNRRQLDRYLEGKLMRTSSQTTVYLMLIDIDHFKKINDTYGHLEGDRAITMVANALKLTFIEQNCFIARYGGDEFAIVMECTEEQTVQKYIERLNQYLSKINKNDKLQFSVSIGVSNYREEGIHDANQLINIADQRMYESKREKNL